MTSTYDLAGRVLAVRDESGISSFTLDPLGRRTKVFDPSGVQLRYTYDAVGNRLTMRDQDAGLTTYEYNANDQLELLVNPFGDRRRKRTHPKHLIGVEKGPTSAAYPGNDS